MRDFSAESQVMEALWRRGPLTPDGVVAEVGEAHDWAPGTVKTLITRLLRKGAIAGAREAGGYLYRPWSRATTTCSPRARAWSTGCSAARWPRWSPISPSIGR